MDDENSDKRPTGTRTNTTSTTKTTSGDDISMADNNHADEGTNEGANDCRADHDDVDTFCTAGTTPQQEQCGGTLRRHIGELIDTTNRKKMASSYGNDEEKKLSRNVDDRVVTTYNGEEKDKMKAGSQFALSAASQSRSKHDHSETQKKKEEELDDNEVKYQRRLAQNRKTAQLRRNRGRMYLERLETEKKMLQDYHICLQEERRKLKHYHSVLLSMLNNSNQPGGGSALLHQQRGEGLSLSSAPQVLPQPPQIGGGIISPPQFGPLRSQQQKLLQQDSTRGLLLDSPDAFCQPRQKRHLQQANNLPHLPPFLPQQPPPASQQHLNNIIQQHKSNTHQRAAFMASALGGAGGLGSSGHVPSALVCAGHRNSTLSSNFLPRSLLVYENHLLQQSYKEQALGRSRQGGSPSTFSHLFNDSHNPNHGEIQQGHSYYHDHFQQQRTDKDIEKQLQHQGRMLSDHEMSSSPNMPPLNANLKQQEKREDK